MNILISGIHGFVGTNLITTLSGQHILYGLDIVSPHKEGVIKTFSWAEVESIDSFEQLPRFDAIIHLAGKAHDTKKQSVAQDYFDINTGLTQKIFDFFLKSSAKKFIFFSSVKAVAASIGNNILTEDVTPMPIGPYGESKMKAEEYIKESFVFPSDEIVLTNEKRVYILRPCMIHGPGNKGNLNLLYSVVKKGIPWPLGSFENRRSFTSIDNLCVIIAGLLTQEIPSGIYHIADDEALSTNELIAVMCEVMRKRPRIWKINKEIMEGCAKLGTLLHLPLNTERLQKLTESYAVSNEKIKKALGLEKMPITARDGLIKTIRSLAE